MYLALFNWLISKSEKNTPTQPKETSPEKITISIFDFSSDVLSKSESIGLTQLFSTELVGSSKFSIKRTAYQNALISENKYDVNCNDVVCAAEIGRLLSVKYVIIGSVTEVAGQKNLSIELISAKTTEIISTFNKAFDRDKTSELIRTLAEEVETYFQKEIINKRKPPMISALIEFGGGYLTSAGINLSPRKNQNSYGVFTGFDITDISVEDTAYRMSLVNISYFYKRQLLSFGSIPLGIRIKNGFNFLNAGELNTSAIDISADAIAQYKFLYFFMANSLIVHPSTEYSYSLGLGIELGKTK